jgi:hypothetical protein
MISTGLGLTNPKLRVWTIITLSSLVSKRVVSHFMGLSGKYCKMKCAMVYLQNSDFLRGKGSPKPLDLGVVRFQTNSYIQVLPMAHLIDRTFQGPNTEVLSRLKRYWLGHTFLVNSPKKMMETINFIDFYSVNQLFLWPWFHERTVSHYQRVSPWRSPHRSWRIIEPSDIAEVHHLHLLTWGRRHCQAVNKGSFWVKIQQSGVPELRWPMTSYNPIQP